MDKRKQRDAIQHALNSTLSGLQDDPWLTQRVIVQAKGEKKVKKKFSIGLVVVLVLILAAVTALAAVTLNSLYEKIIEQEGQKGLIKEWDTQNLIALINWMQEAGIQLDEDQLSILDDELTDEQKRKVALAIIEGYYPARDGILTSVDIIAKEKGPIERWSLEDKNWLSDMLEQYQPSEVAHGRNLLPGEEDISEEEAKAVFFAALEEKYGQTEEDFDLDTFTTSFGTGRFTIDNTTEENVRYWTFTVQTRDHQDTATGFIRATGEAIQVTSFGAVSRTWVEDYADDRTAFNARTSAEGFYQLLHKWKPIFDEMIESGELDPNARGYANSDLMYWYSITDVVGLPREGDLTQEEAREFADMAILDQLGWTAEELACFTPWVSYRTDDPERPVYWFVYRWYGMNNAFELFEQGKITRKVVVQIDAQTGETVKLEADNEIYVDGGRSNSVGM